VDGVLSALVVVVGLLIIAWLCGPADHRGQAAGGERGQATMDDASARPETLEASIRSSGHHRRVQSEGM
jgi:hypothetical protein